MSFRRKPVERKSNLIKFIDPEGVNAMISINMALFQLSGKYGVENLNIFDGNNNVCEMRFSIFNQNDYAKRCRAVLLVTHVVNQLVHSDEVFLVRAICESKPKEKEYSRFADVSALAVSAVDTTMIVSHHVVYDPLKIESAVKDGIEKICEQLTTI